MNPDIDKLDWAILDSLSDDYESLEQIVPSVQEVEAGATVKLIEEKVQRLLALGLICTMGENTSWYGMTPRGCDVWEGHSATFSDVPPDWSGSWAMGVDYKTGNGHVNGVSRELCESAIANHAGLDIIVDPTSFKHSTIDRFQAKYYKELKGGHRIDFRFRMKEA